MYAENTSPARTRGGVRAEPDGPRWGGESESAAFESMPASPEAFVATAGECMDSALSAFYRADRRRAKSPERDLGLRWRSAHGTTYRAAWIAATEEVYSVRHSGRRPAEVRVLGRMAHEALERALGGWQHVCDCGRPGSYEWLLERMASAGREATAY